MSKKSLFIIVLQFFLIFGSAYYIISRPPVFLPQHEDEIKKLIIKTVKEYFNVNGK